ncbi:uncharacterized protein B0H64DRAFT_100125 [Chaetomium fimeti]|uniref:Uncharacterized protein n=1 Tax=Chaetomium fimeti TaxID=1854472 RepID=A0AAE0HMS8_9PEZI|nr:hypothetical protein B0H64DRAFT_100125 [Chaetomium fimeti]
MNLRPENDTSAAPPRRPPRPHRLNPSRHHAQWRRMSWRGGKTCRDFSPRELIHCRGELDAAGRGRTPNASDEMPRLCQPPAFLRRQLRISRAQPIKAGFLELHHASEGPYRTWHYLAFPCRSEHRGRWAGLRLRSLSSCHCPCRRSERPGQRPVAALAQTSPVRQGLWWNEQAPASGRSEESKTRCICQPTGAPARGARQSRRFQVPAASQPPLSTTRFTFFVCH